MADAVYSPKWSHLSLEELVRLWLLNEIVKSYESIYLIDNLDVDLTNPDQRHNSHFVSRDTYDLANLIQLPTCIESEKRTLLDVTNEQTIQFSEISCMWNWPKWSPLT